ncbi:MAG: hypothetical protein DRQ55_06145 [Planctomycetota bacterium]|nr:MAG: hypothetical protein DRQ55_06145 [Planctomycetota bacterium]
MLFLSIHQRRGTCAHTRALLIWAGMLALGLLAPGAHAQSIDSVTPAAGTLGSLLSITGTGFGETRGKLTLVDEDAKKDPRLAILSWSDTAIEARVKRAPDAGPTTLQLHPNDGGLAAAAFSVLPPVITGFSQTIAAPREKLSIFVQDLGNRRPRVDVGWKRIRVVKLKPVEGAPDDREVIVRVPRRAVADGVWNVRVTNQVGADLVKTTLQIQGSKRKQIARRQVLGTVRDLEFVTKAGGMKTVVLDDLVLTTASGKSKDKTLQSTLELAFEQPPLIPTSFSGPPVDQARLTYTEVVEGVETTWTSDGVPLSITIQSRVKRQFAGIYSATLTSPGQPDVAVDGAFVNRLP